MDMVDILVAATHAKASDIHIAVGKPPMIRKNGRMQPMTQFPPLTEEEAKGLIYSMLYQEQIGRFEDKLELDFSYNVMGLSRFRVNVLLQKEGIEAVMRLIPSHIPTAKEISLPDAAIALTRLPRGLILVTGPTGSGKTTTIASMIDIINVERHEHIITIEDPIEFVYGNKNCLVRQREVGTHTHSFAGALKHSLRQDPDVILVGEMRDLETISLAVTAAETGHLVFATLHTQDAPQTVDRVIDVFPSHQQAQMRIQLAATLRAVICQQLLPRADGKGRVAARELMLATPAISNLIREGKTHQLYSSIETGGKTGMFTLETSLAQLVKENLISLDEAFTKANNPESLRIKLNALGVRPQ